MTLVSAVVVNHNGDQEIMRCVRDLLDLEPTLHELAVVDNGSTDGSPQAIRQQFPQVDVVEMGQNLGPAAARNAGLARASAPLVLFVDDDVYLTRECLTQLMECQQREQATVVAPRLVLLPESDVIQADGGDVHYTGTMRLHHGRERVDDVPPVKRPIGAFSSSCLLVDRAAVLEARGFDESFFIYQEDMELALRLRSFGHRLFCQPEAIAFHDRGSGTPGLSFRDKGAYPKRRAYLTLRNRQRMMLLHYRLRTLIVLAPALAIYELASVVLTIRKGWLGAWLRAWWWQVSQVPTILRRRRWIQRSRRIEDAQLLVAGVLPIAPGVVTSKFANQAVRTLSSFLNFYWRVCRPFVAGGSTLRGTDEQAGHTAEQDPQ